MKGFVKWKKDCYEAYLRSRDMDETMKRGIELGNREAEILKELNDLENKKDAERIEYLRKKTDLLEELNKIREELSSSDIEEK